MQTYQFDFYFTATRVTSHGPVLLPDLRTAHEYGVELLERTLADLDVCRSGWLLRVSDQEGFSHLHIIASGAAPAAADDLYYLVG